MTVLVFLLSKCGSTGSVKKFEVIDIIPNKCQQVNRTLEVIKARYPVYPAMGERKVAGFNRENRPSTTGYNN